MHIMIIQGHPDPAASRSGHALAKAGYLRIFLGCLVCLVAVSQAAADVGGMFAKGRTHIAIHGGTGYAFDDEYFVIGVSGAYYLANGLSVGLAVESWGGGEPGILKVTPSLQYVFAQADAVKPYFGVFYRRAYIENLPDLDSAGGRVGIMLASGRNAYMGLGAVYETYLDCDETVYRRCDEVYPELSLTFAF